MFKTRTASIGLSMELTHANIISSLILLVNRILCRGIEKFFASVHFLIQSFFTTKWREQQIISRESRNPNESTQSNLHISELKMVMDRLSMVSAQEEGGDESFGVSEFSELFSNEEPSLQEVKETFDVFDVKKDGFIDANELQRVMCSLGLNEGYELEKCRRMIDAFDGNRDGLIDFNEFVKFMEKCLVEG